MSDEIFWGNLIGLLKRGHWNMSGGEALAFAAIYEEVQKRSKPMTASVVKAPIKEEKKLGNK